MSRPATTSPGPACAAAALFCLAAGLRAQQDPRPLLVEADRILLAPGEILTGADARLLIRGGKIAGVGRAIPAESAARARRIGLDGAFVAPGLFLVHDLLDSAPDLAETIDPFTPDLRAADAFDPFAEALLDRPRTGVTALTLAPASANTFGGIACIVKPGRAEAGGLVAVRDGYLKLALVAEALTDDRFPTSRMGAADLIRTSFAAARAPLGPRTPALDVLRGVDEGAVRIAVHARTHAEITTVLDLAAELGFTPILLDAVEIEDATLERLRGSGISVALSPLGYAATAERLALPARLAAAGVRFSFAADDGLQLRRAAALAMRHGLGRTAAQAAITEVPAEQAGFGERAGTLRVGRDADFVVMTGDPVDLSSRLLQVWVDGARVFEAGAAGTGQEETR
jgi:imidazolonepropionase-like amidohydrolase